MALVVGVDLDDGGRRPGRGDDVAVADGAADARRRARVVLNDAYNAGPASMEAALRALAHLDARRRIAVLGPMAELGDTLGGRASRASRLLADDLGVRDDRGRRARVRRTERCRTSRRRAMRWASSVPDDAVLVKGSRVAGLETAALSAAARIA